MATALWYDLSMKRGDSLEFVTEFTRGGFPVDLTLPGSKVWFTAKRNQTDADVDAVFQIGNTAPLSGVTVDEVGFATFVVPPTATAAPIIEETTVLYFDIQVMEAGGKISTTTEGTLTIEVDITQAVS